ncbi:MAG TPA: toxic anion resistance protein [Ilumatobacteraceae bacterium]
MSEDRVTISATTLAPEEGFGSESTVLPTPPKTMSASEVTEARRQASELVRYVRDSDGSDQLAAIDEVSSVGLKSQRNAGRQLELVRGRMATLLDSGSAGKSLANELVNLRVALDNIDPSSGDHNRLSRLRRSLPFVRNKSMLRTLKKVAIRYEPATKQITIIETKLRAGRALLVRDNVELRRLYEDIEGQQDAIKRQTYLGQLLLQELEALRVDGDDPLQRDRLQAAKHDVASRVQDLLTMQEVHVQYFVGIELTRQNNQRLGQAVDRTLTLATNVVTVGLALQAALVRQREVQEATERTRQFLGELIVSNATAVRRQTEEIGDLYQDPVIAMDKLTQAHHELVAALDVAGKLREQGIDTARRNIDELTVLTQELDQRVHASDHGSGGPQ